METHATDATSASVAGNEIEKYKGAITQQFNDNWSLHYPSEPRTEPPSADVNAALEEKNEIRENKRIITQQSNHVSSQRDTSATQRESSAGASTAMPVGDCGAKTPTGQGSTQPYPSEELCAAASAATAAVEHKVQATKAIVKSLTIASLSIPDARLVLAYPHSSEVIGESATISLPPAPDGRNLIGVQHTVGDVDFTIKLLLDNNSPNIKQKDVYQHSKLLNCQIIYNPAGSTCLLINRMERALYLTLLESDSSTACVHSKASHEIHPGIWRISIGDSISESNLDEHHVYVLILERRFQVISLPQKPLNKRAAPKDLGDKPTKRQRFTTDIPPPDTAVPVTALPDTALPDTAVPVTAVPVTALPDNTALLNNTAVPDNTAPPDTAPPDTAQANPGSSNSSHLASITSSEIKNTTNTTSFLQLEDGEKAIIKDQQADRLATYQLERIKLLGRTAYTSVFTCQHSAIKGVVAVKIPRFNNHPLSHLSRWARNWTREKTILEHIEHVSLLISIMH